MPYTLPRDMVAQLRWLAGDVIEGPWDKRAVMGEAGGRIPVEGPMGGGGRVIQMPSRAAQGHEAEIARRIAERQAQRGVTPDQAAYEAAVARQQQPFRDDIQRVLQQNPSGRMRQVDIDMAAKAAKDPARNAAIWGGNTPRDTAQTSFGRLSPGEMNRMRDQREMAQYGRLLSEFERANLYRPGWEPPQ